MQKENWFILEIRSWFQNLTISHQQWPLWRSGPSSASSLSSSPSSSTPWSFSKTRWSFRWCQYAFMINLFKERFSLKIYGWSDYWDLFLQHWLYIAGCYSQWRGWSYWGMCIHWKKEHHWQQFCKHFEKDLLSFSGIAFST